MHVRRIAILVTSLDAAAARQLLSHMPPELAKQVRKAVANLSYIDPNEQERVLSDFRKQALTNSLAPKTPSLATTPASAESVTYVRELTSSARTRTKVFPESHSENKDRFTGTRESKGSQQQIATSSSRFSIGLDSDARIGQSSAEIANSGTANSARNDSALKSMIDQESWRSDATAEFESPHSRSWKGLDSDALIHLLRGERPAVIAVVLSQLSPESAVALLKSLPSHEHSKILARLARLQDIDEEAMTAIDDHLARRLHDYRHEITSASESLARIEALLSVAPQQLREQWLKDITSQDTDLALRLGISIPQPESGRPENSEAAPEKYSLLTASPGPRKQSNANVEALANHVVTTADLLSPSDLDGDVPQILPFAGKQNSIPTDTSLVSIEFEQILDLPSEQLAQVLSMADAEVVLLALAGASPVFMQRFYDLLDRQDARALQKRLRNIGPLNLRDIDEAQLEVAELAARISLPSGTHRQLQPPVKRVAA